MVTSAADVVAQTLAAAGVRTVFGVVGTSTMDLLDAIARTAGMEFVSAHTEEGAGHMADGYARATGRVGVVLSHVGPGALRQMYAVGTAWKDGVPLLAMTGNEVIRMTDSQAREAYHVVDVLDLYRPITKATLQLRDGADARTIVARALWLASAGRPGPVLLDLPKSSLKQPADPVTAMVSVGDHVPAQRPLPGTEEVRTVADALRTATCPVLYAGGGIHWSAATSALVTLAEQANLPVLTTDGGRGAVPEDHPLAAGVIARQAGDDCARALLGEADCILALGTPFSDVSTFEWSGWSPTCRVYQVDISPEVAHKGISPTGAVQADLREFLVALAAHLADDGYRCVRDWRSQHEALEAERAGFLSSPDADGDGVNPWVVIDALSRLLPRSAFVSVDSGMHSFFGNKLRVLEPRTYLGSIGFGAMGYSFPAVLGAVEGVSGRRGVAIVGDGCLSMTLGEFETAARRRSPVTVVVMNDASFASQLNHQKRRFAGRLTGTRFQRTDYVKVAEAQGVPGWSVTANADVEQAVAAALSADGPNVLDVRVNPDITPRTWIEGSGDARTSTTPSVLAGAP